MHGDVDHVLSGEAGTLTRASRELAARVVSAETNLTLRLLTRLGHVQDEHAYGIPSIQLGV